MRKKIILSSIAIIAVVGGVAAMSAYEAHVINVTAKIENALKVIPPEEMTFGTVFPQEKMVNPLLITTSDSFCSSTQTRVTSIDYKIVQKPKPIWPQTLDCKESHLGIDFENIDEARAYCHEYPENLDCCYPSLCPYLSKTIIDVDPEPYTDYGVPAFHNPEDPSSVALGTIDKFEDTEDFWLIDLDVPCFEGMCAQDWTHQGWELDPALESETFGCDLWIEVTDIYGGWSEKEEACINSGGTVTTRSCCLIVGDFPDECSVGACSCSPEYSHEVRACDCGEGKCFDGNTCINEEVSNCGDGVINGDEECEIHTDCPGYPYQYCIDCICRPLKLD